MDLGMPPLVHIYPPLSDHKATLDGYGQKNLPFFHTSIFESKMHLLGRTEMHSRSPNPTFKNHKVRFMSTTSYTDFSFAMFAKFRVIGSVAGGKGGT